MKQKVQHIVQKMISYVLLFCTMIGMTVALGDVHTAKAAEYTHDCPSGGYDKFVSTWWQTGDSYLVSPYFCYGYMAPENFKTGWSDYNTYIYIPYYVGETFLGSGNPVAGNSIHYSDIALETNITSRSGKTFYNIPINVGQQFECSLCGKRWEYSWWDSDNYEYQYSTYTPLSTEISNIRVATLKCTEKSADPTFVIENIQTLDSFVRNDGGYDSYYHGGKYYGYYYYEYYSESSGSWSFSMSRFYDWKTPSQAANNPHTYTTSHTCNDKCYEVLHTHDTTWDETEYEYTCDCTETVCEQFSNTSLSRSVTGCHAGRFVEKNYSCARCGKYLYQTKQFGCNDSFCRNFYGSNDEYVNESHPGTHTYTHVGKRYLCNGGQTYNANIRGDKYRTCAYCATPLNYAGSFTADFGNFTATVSYTTNNAAHYYYVKEPLESCYTYGEIHASRNTSATTQNERQTCDTCVATYYDVYQNYNCTTCGREVYWTGNLGHSGCGTRYQVGDKGGKIHEIGDIEYSDYSSGSDKYTIYALHQTKDLTCTTATHGDKICDKVVTELIPLEPKQKLLAGAPLNTKAYAKFLDGHIELVECAREAEDTPLYNEWKDVTISYGMYSSVSSKTPQTATIRVYEERVDFDVTASPEDSSMGSVTGSGAYTVGTEAKVTAEPREGYEFEGWYKDGVQVSTDKEYAFTMPAENIVLVAKFTPKSFQLTVSSESTAKGTVSQSIADGLVAYKTPITVTATPKTGFTFLGWYHGAQKLELEASDTLEMPAHDFDLVAKFSAAKVTVSFNSTGGTACTPKEVSYLGMYGELPVPVKSGYVFLGWMYGTRYVMANSPVEQRVNHTLTAAWAEAGPEFILVDFGNIYGDNSWSRDSANIGGLGLTASNLKYHLPVPTRMGYSFLNWYFTENELGNGDDLGNPDNTVTKDTVVTTNKQHTIHAGWKENDYTLSFESNGGSSCDSMTITYDRPYGYHKSLPTPTKAGYTFTGWYSSNLEGNGIGTLITDSTRVQTAEDQTVYAGWTKDKVYVDVTFDARTKEQVGLTLPESILLGHGSTIGSITSGAATRTVEYPGTYGAGLPVVKRTGYTFTGWDYNGTEVTEDTAVQAAFDHTVYATYEPKQNTITLNGQGATTHTQTSATATFDQRIPDVVIPKKTGYQFLGYFTQTNGQGEMYYNADGKGLVIWQRENNITLYAHWKKMTSITYHPNGGTGSMPVTYLEPGITRAMAELNAFTRNGYTFTGWNTKVDGSGSAYAEGQTITGITSDLILYAQWEKEYNRIVYKANGGRGTMADTVVDGAVTNAYLSANSFTRDGYTFAYWCTDENCPGKNASGHTHYSNGAYVPYFKGTLELYAQWDELKINYTLTYMKYPYGTRDNETFSTQKLTYKQAHTILGAPYMPEGYSVGYNFNVSSSMSTRPEELSLTDENTLTDPADFAGWQLYKKSGNAYIQTGYTFTEGQVVSKLTLTNDEVLYLFPGWEGGKSSVVIPNASCNGYEFSGWSQYQDGSGTRYYPTDNFTPVKNTTLYAVWTPKPVVLDINALYTKEGVTTEHNSLALSGGITLGTFDLTVNGVKVADDVTDFNGTLSFDDEYAVTDIKVNDGYSYRGVKDGYLYGGVSSLGVSGKLNDAGSLNGKTYIWLGYSPAIYTISYELDGGTMPEGAPSDYAVIYSQKDSNSIDVPEKLGYEFMGWYDAPNPGGKQVYKKDGSYVVGTYWTQDGRWNYAGNVKVYAYWKANVYTLTYDVAGNKPDATTSPVLATPPATGTYDVTFTVGNPSRIGYTFLGWNISGMDTVCTHHYGSSTTTAASLNKVKATTFKNLRSTAGTVSFKAQWENNNYALTLNPNTGVSNAAYTAPLVVTFDKDTHKNISGYVPSKLGYTFTGWYTESSGGTKVYNADGSCVNDGTYWKDNLWCYVDDVTLYAQWKANVYTLTYDVAGNKPDATTSPVLATPPATGTYDVTFTVGNPSRTGYTFLGWNISGMDTVCTHHYGSSTTTAASLTKVKATTFKNLRSTAGTVSFKAQWENNNYTLTLNPNTGVSNAAYTAPLVVTFDKDTHKNISGYVPSKLGYTFTGWYTESSGGTKVYNADGSCVNDGTYWKDNLWCYVDDVTLYAQWKANSYTITINGNKGTGSSNVTVPYSSVTLTFDSTNHYYNGINHSNYLANNLASRPGYTFQGYYTAASGGVQLYTSAGAIANSGTVSYGSYASGYYFYQNKYKYASHMTVYAQWSPITYTITLNLNDAGAIPVARIPYGSFNIVFDTSGHIYGESTKTDYLASNLPTRVGYTFAGWYTAASGGTKVYNANGSIVKDGTYFDADGEYVYPGNVTLYAHWTANQYGLTLNGNKGTGSTTVTVPYSTVTMTYDSTNHIYNGTGHSDYLAGNLASRVGYIFQGYYTASENGIKIYNANGSLAAQTIADARAESLSGYYFHTGRWKVAGNLSLHAQWKAKEYDITLNDRGATSTGHTETVHMTFDQMGANIIVPTKTGYTFHGYYTGTRGSGTQYYNADGICIKTWTEDDKNVLYAFWTQDPVVLPNEGDRTEPTPLPEMDKEGNIGRTDSKGLLYADDYSFATNAETDMQPYLTYDTPATEGAIPGTEEVAFRAKMGSWMLSYKLHRSSGLDYVRIYVTVPYRTQYERSSDEELVISNQQLKTYSFLIPKAWSYWEILESGMYYPDKVRVVNGALKNAEFTVNVDRTGANAVIAPAYEVVQYGNKENHVFWNEYDADGSPVLRITLTDEQYIISERLDTLPNIEPHLTIVCGNAAWDDERQADVKSDRYVFDGKTVLFDTLNDTGNGEALQESNLPSSVDDIDFTSYQQTYVSGVELDEYEANGTYTTNSVITYVGDASNIGTPATKTVALTDVNDLKIHTPVACEGVAVEGIKNGELVLQDELNFFTLRVDNVGTHRLILGYGEKDFSYALSGKSNVAVKNGNTLNQVQFTFDVYLDVGGNSRGSDGSYDTTGDMYYEAGTWLTVGENEHVFYVPVSLEEGEYNVRFRTIAVNCPMDGGEYSISGREEVTANSNPLNYVATDSMKVKVRLSVENFEIINTNDPTALAQLRDDKQALVLKLGYKFAYRLTTLGGYYGANAQVRIKPSYYYVSKDGFERVPVDLYYSAVIQGKKQNFVRAGGTMDATNLYTVRNNSAFLKLSDVLLRKSGTISGLSDFVGKDSQMYSLGNIAIDRYFRMFPGLAMQGLPIAYCSTCHVVYESEESSACTHGLTNTKLNTLSEKLLQEWYGEFSIPTSSFVIRKDVMKGYCSLCERESYMISGQTNGDCGHALSGIVSFDFDEYVQKNTLSGTEGFIANEGYLAVCFDIQVKTDRGEWITFTDWENTKLYMDFSGNHRYEMGDVIWYDLSLSSADDYEVGGTE